MLLEFLIQKMKKQHLDFEVAPDFFIDMKCDSIQNYLKKM